MKCELFDLQTALNACRNSLKNLNISSSMSTLCTRDLDYRSVDFVPCLNSTAKKSKKNRSTKKMCRKSRPKTKHSDLDSISTSSCSSFTQSSTFTYPTSSYHSSCQYPIKFKSIRVRKNSNRNFGYQIVAKQTTTTTTTTTDEYSAKFSTCTSCRSSKFKNMAFNLTPVKASQHSRKPRPKYDFNSIFYPYKTLPGKLNELKIKDPKMNTLSSISSPSHFSDKFCNTDSLKDQFLVINHKNEVSENQTIFEPKESSTPVKHCQKTSTPKMIDNSYFENILIDLEANSNKLMKLLSKDSNKISDYFSSSAQFDDENEYDLPGPRTIDNHEYQSANVGFKDDTLVETRQGLTSTPVKSVKVNFVSDCQNNESENLTRISTLESMKKIDRESLIYSESQSFRNISLASTTSSVRSSVIKCCIKPFQLLYNNRNMKKKI
ncbi:hypothetical protein BpHYR1_038435 [Brachionus plicatilis]|uniref:Uncharacterized protein n=1 Tax=Brachionus plicatilis TaxID=10195 RepID=A0A3M7Q163_BRAPC|nr:hypothetical protein BpHYR1_038435 [Brachionus plicatilis]